MTPHLHHAASNYVFRLLGRQRAKARRVPGLGLDEALTTLRESGQSALIEVELADGSLGRLLIQVGRVVFAQHESATLAEALTEIQQGLEKANLYILTLDDEQIILACAALQGIPLALGEALAAGPEHLAALLTQLKQQNFTGVVALEQGLETLIWRFQRGRTLNTVKLPVRIRAGRLTQLVWQEQMLRDLSAAGAATASISPELADTHTSAVSKANGVTQRSTSPQPERAAQPANVTPPKVTPPTSAAATKPHLAAQSKPTLAAAQPQREVPASATTPTAPLHPSSAQHPQSSWQGSKHLRRNSGEDTQEVWAQFREILYAHLGGRAERAFDLMQRELGGFSKADLVLRLALQVERIAGVAAAKMFRERF